MKTEIKDYKIIAEIDGEIVYADKDGYFVIEHYPLEYGGNTIILRIGKTAKQVLKNFIIGRDWSYRAWNGEIRYILEECKKIKELPDIE